MIVFSALTPPPPQKIWFIKTKIYWPRPCWGPKSLMAMPFQVCWKTHFISLNHELGSWFPQPLDLFRLWRVALPPSPAQSASLPLRLKACSVCWKREWHACITSCESLITLNEWPSLNGVLIVSAVFTDWATYTSGETPSMPREGYLLS